MAKCLKTSCAQLRLLIQCCPNGQHNGYRQRMKESQRQYQAAYYKKHKAYYQKRNKELNQIRKATPEYKEQQRINIIIKCSKISSEFAEKTSARARLWSQIQLTKDKLNRTISHNIRESLYRKGGSKKGRHWEYLVGYTVDDLTRHLEKQFTEGMTWDNYGRGGWEIDHIIPVSKLNFSDANHEDFKRCWALDNLQPLWKVDNIRKRANLDRPFQPSLAM